MRMFLNPVIVYASEIVSEVDMAIILKPSEKHKYLMGTPKYGVDVEAVIIT